MLQPNAFDGIATGDESWFTSCAEELLLSVNIATKHDSPVQMPCAIDDIFDCAVDPRDEEWTKAYDGLAVREASREARLIGNRTKRGVRWLLGFGRDPVLQDILEKMTEKGEDQLRYRGEM
jgi:hypothetical protein